MGSGQSVVGYGRARCQWLPCHLKVPAVFLGQRKWVPPAESDVGDEGPDLRLWKFSELRWRVGECLRLIILCGFPPVDFLQQNSALGSSAEATY